MFEMFEKASFWDNAFYISCFVFVIILIQDAYIRMKKTPTKKMNFIKQAIDNKCMTVGKMTCFIVNGKNGNPEHYETEYMYFVNNKKYFVTYEILANIPINEEKEEFDADMLLLDISQAIILFYNKDNPSEVISKFEVFSSPFVIHKIKTMKRNAWRDTEKNWVDPINLIRY